MVVAASPTTASDMVELLDTHLPRRAPTRPRPRVGLPLGLLSDALACRALPTRLRDVGVSLCRGAASAPSLDDGERLRAARPRPRVGLSLGLLSDALAEPCRRGSATWACPSPTAPRPSRVYTTVIDCVRRRRTRRRCAGCEFANVEERCPMRHTNRRRGGSAGADHTTLDDGSVRLPLQEY